MDNPIFRATETEFKVIKDNYSGTRSEYNKETKFAVRLRELRKKSKLSQEKLGERIGVKDSTVSLWETGETLPDAKAIYNMSVLFGVTTDYLLCRTDDEFATIHDIRILMARYGFSKKAAREICVLSNKSNGKWANSRFEAFNALIEQTDEFEAILQNLYECLHFYQTVTPLEFVLKKCSFDDEMSEMTTNAEKYIRTDRAQYRSAVTYNPQHWLRVVADRFLKMSEIEKTAPDADAPKAVKKGRKRQPANPDK